MNDEDHAEFDAVRAAVSDEIHRLARDEADGAERRAVMADMESVSADWPE